MGSDILSFKSDRISVLPEDVTDTILTFLPLREVVRTSILSRKWRYRWIKLSKLVFDENICQMPKGDKFLASYKLISTINKILVLHVGPLIEFHLTLSLLESCPEIDHLMIFLSTCSLQAFLLNIMAGERYKLHSSFFSCWELRYLYLSNCIFTPPSAFNGFPRLVSLTFEKVVFSVDEFDDFISSCLELEYLTLIDPPEFHCLALSSPNLQYLHVEGVCEFLSFGDLSHLQSALFFISRLSNSLQDKETCRFAQFFCCLPVLKKLVANYDLLAYLAIGGVPKELQVALSIETLELYMISLDVLNVVSSIFCLINSCPSIQRIEFKIYGESDYEDDEDEVLDFLMEQDCRPDVMLNELREVHLMGVHGVKSELEFIKLLLAKSPVLEIMLIVPLHEDDFLSLELLKKITRFQRASSKAEIIFE